MEAATDVTNHDADVPERRQQIVRRIIDYFGTQEALASQPELMIDQSAVSLWLKRGRIPADRQDQILAASVRMHREGKKDRAIEPWEFFQLPDERSETMH